VLWDRAHAFALVRERPWLWLLIAVAYPVVSVVPQEVVFRAFFLHRYRGILGGEATGVVGSAVAFGAAHLVLHNWLAVVLTLGGGFLFARTYLRTRSLPATAWEHALYGVGLFTVGLGRFFVTRWVQPP
jgi:membrane protease YdiL (CAAX protease family)